MKLAATEGKGVFRTELHLLEDDATTDTYKLSNAARQVDIKLNHVGLPLDKPLYSFIGSELALIRWAQIQISAGKKNGTWLL